MVTQVKPDESRRIDIFYEGDENVTEVCFENPDKDLKWVLNYFRRGDKRPYSVPLREEEDNLIWTVTLADTAKPGMGIAQLVGSGKDQTKHSGSYSVFVGKSLVNPGDVPAADKAFLDKVAKEAAEAQTAAENTKTLYNRIQAGLADGSFRGEKGEQGERGEQGPAGSTGPAGEQGPEGKQGPIGPTGPQGPQGIQGERGPIGPAGPTGPKGDQGERGLTGPTGPQGETGPQGPQGEPGAKGEKGDTGPSGADGKDGAPGKDGLDAPQIDDTAVSDAAPWSSKKIIETLCPPLEASGNPVTCEPVAGYPLGVVASWEPTQAGSGEPYPAGGGPNLLDISKCTAGFTPYGLTTAISGELLTIKGTAATTSESASFVVAKTPDTSLSGKGYKVTAFPAKGSITNAYGLRTADEPYIAVLMPLTEGAAVDVALRIMVSKDTPTAYAPYENIRPISGREAVTVERCGGNYIDIKALKKRTVSSCRYESTTETGFRIVCESNGTYKTCLFYLPWHYICGQTITVSFDVKTKTGAADPGIRIIGYADDYVQKTMLKELTGLNIGTRYSATVSFPKQMPDNLDGYAINFYATVSNASAGDYSEYDNVQIEIGAATSAYTPYRGDTLALALPSTICGGTVDAVTGEGQQEWGLATFDGSEAWTIGGLAADKSDWYYVSPKFGDAINAAPKAGNEICSHYPHYDVANSNTGKGCALVWRSFRVRWGDIIPENTDAWKSYLAAQYAAGTPVQIAYKLAAPVPFQATGNGPLLPIPAEPNTVMTDADSVTVAGRADPIRIIQQLQAAQNTAAVQLAETQQQIVDTTAMAVDYIFEQDSQIFGGEDDDDQTDAVPT